MDLIEALQKQMNFCEMKNNYRCGIYITTEANKDIVMKVIDNLLPAINRNVEVRNNQCESLVKYPNGSIIRILRANNNARAQRFNGAIIDSNIYHINQEIINMIILPCLIPLKSETGVCIAGDNPRNREYYCCISKEDVVESEKHKKEYKYMFYENDYDRPVVEKELNGDKVMLYEAWGIPEDMVTYETEFINKTKQTYLNIKGEFKNEKIGFENGINVHLLIDTRIYDGYEVHVKDGLVTVVLHEIKNEAPVLKDYGVA